MIRAAAALAILIVPAVGFAQDARIVERFYDPAKVVRIEGRTKVQATIQFGEDEAIENVAVGDSQAWQVTPNKRANLLFVKPLAVNATTNMTVVTDKHTYLFDLVANNAAKPLYVLKFTYPEEPKKPAMAMAEGVTAEELAAAEQPQAVTDPADLNFAWTTAGDRKLLPARIYDDGLSTFLIWPKDTAVPAILIKDPAGTEGPVNFTVRGGVVVVEGVPREMVLRSGKSSATMINGGPVRPQIVPPQAALARTDPQAPQGDR